jgi:hypothetical protein
VEKRNQTRSKHILEDPDYLKNILQLRKETCMEKYGVEHFTQTEQQYASHFKRKPFILPSGKIIKVQGYEPFAIKMLLNSGRKEEEFMFENISSVAKFWYEYNEGKHKYFPDIYDITNKTMIEVKSGYTFNIELEEQLEKYKAVILLGYGLRLLVFDRDGTPLLDSTIT